MGEVEWLKKVREKEKVEADGDHMKNGMVCVWSLKNGGENGGERGYIGWWCLFSPLEGEVMWAFDSNSVGELNGED